MPDYVAHLAGALVFLMENYSAELHINVGFGEEITIADLVADIVDFKGRLNFLSDKPGGTPHKLINPSKIRSFGWRPTLGLRDGLVQT